MAPSLTPRPLSQLIKTETATVTTTPTPVMTYSLSLGRNILAVQNNGLIPVTFEVFWSLDDFVSQVPANLLEFQDVPAGETRYSTLTEIRPPAFKVRATASSGTADVTVSLYFVNPQFT